MLLFVADQNFNALHGFVTHILLISPLNHWIGHANSPLFYKFSLNYSKHFARNIPCYQSVHKHEIPHALKTFYVPFLDMRPRCKPSAYFFLINQIYITHDANVYEWSWRTLECFDLPSALMVYSFISNKWQKDTNNSFMLSLLWTNRISLKEAYLVRHSPCTRFFFQAHYIRFPTLIIGCNRTAFQYSIFQLQHYKQFWGTVCVVHIQFLIPIGIISQLCCYYLAHNNFLCGQKVTGMKAFSRHNNMSDKVVPS